MATLSELNKAEGLLVTTGRDRAKLFIYRKINYF